MENLISQAQRQNQNRNHIIKQKQAACIKEEKQKGMINPQNKNNRQSKKKLQPHLERQNETYRVTGNSNGAKDKENFNFNSKQSQIMGHVVNSKNQTKTKSIKNVNHTKSSIKKLQQKGHPKLQYAHIKHLLVHDKKKIPKIISELERNIIQLKKCYNEQKQNCLKGGVGGRRQSLKQNQKNLNTNSTNYTLNFNQNLINTLIDKNLPMKPSQKKLKKTCSQTKLGVSSKSQSKGKFKPMKQFQQNKYPQFQNRSANENMQPHQAQIQVQDVRKSYISTYGKNTSNLLQLYNFYKKELQRSTNIIGSMSISNNKVHSMSINNQSNVDFSSVEDLSKSKSKCITPLLQHSNQYQIFSKETSIQKIQCVLQKLRNSQHSHSKSKSKSKKIDQNSFKRESCSFSKERKSAVLTNPFLQQAGIGIDINLKKDALKKSNKDFLNIQNLLNERKKQRNNMKQNAGMANNMNAKLDDNHLMQQIQKIGKANKKLEQKLVAKEKQEFPVMVSFGKIDQVSKSLKERQSQQQRNSNRNRRFFMQEQNQKQETNKGKSPQEQLQKVKVQAIYKSPDQKESSKKNILKLNQLQAQSKQKQKKSLKSSGNKNSDKRSSSKKSPNILNQAIFFETQGFEKSVKQSSTRRFQSSKYYVQPVPFSKKDISNSLQGLQITLKDSQTSKNLDLDFIPLDI